MVDDHNRVTTKDSVTHILWCRDQDYGYCPISFGLESRVSHKFLNLDVAVIIL